MSSKLVIKLTKQIEALEASLTDHLRESGGIKANLAWNTTFTIGIAVAVVGKLLYDFFFSH